MPPTTDGVVCPIVNDWSHRRTETFLDVVMRVNMRVCRFWQHARSHIVRCSTGAALDGVCPGKFAMDLVELHDQPARA